MSHTLLAIQNILQNLNIFIGSRGTVLFTPVGSKKVTQFSDLPPTSVSYLKCLLSTVISFTYDDIENFLKAGFHSVCLYGVK